MNLKAIREVRNDFRLLGSLVAHTPDIKESSPDYDAYWRDKRGHGTMGEPGIFQFHRARWILPRIDEGDSVAEFGCGDAATLLWLKQRKKIEAIGIDVSDYALDFAKSRGIRTHRVDAKSADWDSLPEADTYLLLEVLEHMPDPEVVLAKVLSKARKKVIISIPNTGYFPYRIRLLFGRFPVQWKLHPAEHLRFWTIRDFRWWLAQLRLSGKSEVHGYKGIPVLNRLLPNAFAMGIICEVRK
jgi:methionine biosynthesis protein MetW